MLSDFQLPIAPAEEELLTLRQHFLDRSAQLESEFLLFKENVNKLLKIANNLLTKKLDTDPVALEETILESSAYSYTIGQAVATARSFTQMYEMLNYYPKRAKLSEADRKLYTQTKCIRQVHLLKALMVAEDKIDRRVMACQSVLRSETARILKSGREV